MPQPRKTLLERVERNTFRADRYANLLHGEWLPIDAPAWADPELWWWLRYEQGWYRDPHRRRERDVHAARFATLVRALHGGPVPAFAAGAGGPAGIRWPLSFGRNPEWLRRRQLVLMGIRPPQTRGPWAAEV